VRPVDIGYYTPYEAVLYQMTLPWNFPRTGADPPPNEIVETKDCLYPDGEDERFGPGVLLLFIICFTIVLIVSVVSFFLWRRWRNATTVELKQPMLISFNDILLMILLFVDLLQYLSVGPDFKSLNMFIYLVSHAASVNLDALVELHSDLFWVLLYITFACVFVWIILGAMFITNTHVKLSHFLCCE
jgi:hypothetical protein